MIKVYEIKLEEFVLNILICIRNSRSSIVFSLFERVANRVSERIAFSNSDLEMKKATISYFIIIESETSLLVRLLV